MKKQTNFDLRAFCKLCGWQLKPMADLLKVSLPPHPNIKTYTAAKKAFEKAEDPYDSYFAATKVVDFAATLEEISLIFTLHEKIDGTPEGKKIFKAACKKEDNFYRQKIEKLHKYDQLMALTPKLIDAGMDSVILLILQKCLTLTSAQEHLIQMKEIAGRWRKGEKGKWSKLYFSIIIKLAGTYGHES